MKVTKKPLLVLAVLTTLIASLLLGGCSKKGISPDKSALALYDLVIKHEVNLDNLPMSEKEAKEFIETSKTTVKNMYKTQLAGMEISDAVLEDLYKKSYEGNKKLEAKAEIVSEDKDKAVVKLTTTPIDAAATQKLFQDKLAKLSPADLQDQAKMLKVFQEYITEMSEKPTLAKEPNSVDFNLKKSGDKWDIADKSELQKFTTLTTK